MRERTLIVALAAFLMGLLHGCALPDPARPDAQSDSGDGGSHHYVSRHHHWHHQH